MQTRAARIMMEKDRRAFASPTGWPYENFWMENPTTVSATAPIKPEESYNVMSDITSRIALTRDYL